MGLEFNYHKGQTPIDEEEKDDLLIKTISTKAELDEFEQANILEAIEWSIKIRQDITHFLTIGFIREVHKRMF